MGYCLKIGEFEPYISPEDRYAQGDVAIIEVDGAPWNSSDRKDNRISPSYSTWARFCKFADLEQLFYGEDGLLAEHPGCKVLTEAHYAAFLAVKKAVPTAIAADSYMVLRLDWLVFWSRWALDNCKHPTFRNS